MRNNVFLEYLRTPKFMDRAPVKNHIQGPISHSMGEYEYERLQQTILDKCCVACTVIARPGNISIRTASLADFYLAKSAIKDMVNGRPIIRDN